jgi:nicotinamidase-related amidase
MNMHEQHPISMKEVVLARRCGLVIVDEIVGFAQVGGGPLAPAEPNAQVTRMVEETDRLARAFLERRWPIFAFMDSHVPGKLEMPYPLHCQSGSGEDEWVPELSWLAEMPGVTQQKKDCINGFVGAIAPDGRNLFLEWINRENLGELVFVGICTDICVMDCVLTLLSARNHGLADGLERIMVYEPGCATYDAPGHPQFSSHHMGLYFMAARGAEILSSLTLAPADSPEHHSTAR